MSCKTNDFRNSKPFFRAYFVLFEFTIWQTHMPFGCEVLANWDFANISVNVFIQLAIGCNEIRNANKRTNRRKHQKAVWIAHLLNSEAKYVCGQLNWNYFSPIVFAFFCLCLCLLNEGNFGLMSFVLKIWILFDQNSLKRPRSIYAPAYCICFILMRSIGQLQHCGTRNCVNGVVVAAVICGYRCW